MDEPPERLGSNVDAIRRAFDAEFAAPLRVEGSALVDLVSIRAGGARYAVRLRDLAGLVPAPKIVPLPSAAAGLLGLAGLRGELIPVFDLAALLGYGERAEARWLLLCRSSNEPLALATAAIDGYLKVPQQDIGAAQGELPSRAHVREAARTDAGVVPILGISSLLAAIEAQTARGLRAEG